MSHACVCLCLCVCVCLYLCEILCFRAPTPTLFQSPTGTCLMVHALPSAGDHQRTRWLVSSGPSPIARKGALRDARTGQRRRQIDRQHPVLRSGCARGARGAPLWPTWRPSPRALRHQRLCHTARAEGMSPAISLRAHPPPQQCLRKWRHLKAHPSAAAVPTAFHILLGGRPPASSRDGQHTFVRAVGRGGGRAPAVANRPRPFLCWCASPAEAIAVSCPRFCSSRDSTVSLGLRQTAGKQASEGPTQTSLAYRSVTCLSHRAAG